MRESYGMLFGKFCRSFSVKYIRGSLTESDWARLRGYTRKISKFIVTDNDSKPQISPSAFLRLARLSNPDMPLLPCLSDLVIADADASIAYLDLLITPSLKSLKASCIPDTQQSTFFSFLTVIEQEVPLLETLVLGPGQFLSSSLQIISQFSSLRHLELKHEGSKLPFAFFDNIGSLVMLKTFILDARYVSGTLTEDETTVLPVNAFNPSPSDNFPISNAMDGDHNEHGASDVRHSKTFNQLEILHVTGCLPLLEDLIHRVTSTKLEGVSVTLIRLSFDELKVSLAEKAEQEILRREEARREEAAKKMEEERLLEERRRREEEEKKKKEEENDASPESPPSPFDHEPPCECQLTHGMKKKKTIVMKRREEREARERLEQERLELEAMMKQREVDMRLLEEQEFERLVGLTFEAQTESFTNILRKLCLTSPSLKSLSVRQSVQSLLNPPTLPEDMFRTMLFLPEIESLEVEGWVLDSVEGVLSAAEQIPNLKCLLLPLGEPNCGIFLPTLRHVAKICPKLESFQCYIDPLSPVPEYSVPTDVGLSHGLRTLSVGSSFPLPPPNKLGYLIARHLYLLFPKLETIRTSEEHDGELWVTADEFVKMFQTARMDDLNRQ
jgi:hypothetical protein